MSLRNAFRIARRELRGGIRSFRVFLACLALGVAAIAAVGSVRQSIELGLEREGAAILGGDAEIQLTYRFASEAERAWMEATAGKVSEIIDFRSMAVVARGSEVERGLTQVKAVDDAYPLYGAVRLTPDMPLAVAFDSVVGTPGAVMDPVLIGRLGLEIGDTFRLGAQEFILTAALEHEPDGAGGGFGLGPRTIVRTADLANSELLQPGTLFDSAYRLRLNPDAVLDQVKAEAYDILDSSGMRWRDSRNGAPGVAEFVERLAAFLVLVGLAGLAVGGVGVSAAVRAYLSEKNRVIATLKTLGAETGTIFLAYAFQVGVLTILGIVLGVTLGAILPLIFAPVIAAQLPVPAVFSLHLAPLAEAALYGALAAAIFTLWPLASTEQIRAAALYRGELGRFSRLPRWRYIFAVVLLLGALIGISAYLSGLARLTYWAAGGLFAAFLLLRLIAFLTRRLAKRLAQARFLRGRCALRMALSSVGGPGNEASSVVLSLGLGLTVLAAVGQIDTNLRGAIERDLPDLAPSYFVVDIQKDQLADFKNLVTSDARVGRLQTAPMMRGMITQINGRPATEVAGDHWVIQGDRGITYSAKPPKGTKVTGGTWWDKGYSGPPQISFAAEEAAEMGLSLGDRLTVNILGRDIEAEITSFRDVDFSNAGIGFVLSMNPAALSGAPHTHIATIYAEEAAEADLLRVVGNAYPNVTMIRVRDGIARVSEILSGIAAATTYGALATLVTGLVVLIGAAAAGQRQRTYEAAILKTLGASRATILTCFALRSAIFGMAAGAVAVLAGGIAGWGVARYIMETDYVFEPVSAISIVFAGSFMTMLSGVAFAWKPLAQRPAAVLRAGA